MTLNCQMYLNRLLKRFCVASIPVKPLEISNSKFQNFKIPAKFLRDGVEVLALPLRNIINLSIKLSTFPQECKIDKLKSIFKKGARTDPKNYRPIPLLPLVS